MVPEPRSGILLTRVPPYFLVANTSTSTSCDSQGCTTSSCLHESLTPLLSLTFEQFSEALVSIFQDSRRRPLFRDYTRNVQALNPSVLGDAALQDSIYAIEHTLPASSSAWYDEGVAIAMSPDRIASSVILVDDYIKAADGHVYPALYRALAARSYLDIVEHQAHYLQFTPALEKRFEADVATCLQSTAAMMRLLVSYYGENIPTTTLDHMVDLLNTWFPDFTTSPLYRPFSPGDHSRLLCKAVKRHALRNSLASVWTVLGSITVHGDLTLPLLLSLGNDAALPQGVLSDVWGYVRTAWEAVSGLITTATKACVQLIKPFAESLTRSLFSSFMSDWFPVDVFKPIVSAVTSIFSPIVEAFGDLFQLVKDDAPPLSFLSGMCSGSRGAVITKWTLGLAVIGTLVWLMVRVSIFSADLLDNIWQTIHDAIWPATKFSYAIITPQGPNTTPLVDVLNVVISLSVALFAGWGGSELTKHLRDTFAGFNSVHKALTDSASSIIALLPACIQRACCLMSNDPSDKIFASMTDWILNANAVISVCSHVGVLSNESIQRAVIDALAQGNNLKSEYSQYLNAAGKDRKVFPDFTLFNSCLTQINRLIAKIMSVNAIQAGRPEPAVLMLYGAAGCGKSMFLTFASQLFAGLPAYNGVACKCPTVYTKVSSDQYFSGLQQDSAQILILDEIWRDCDANDVRGMNMQSLFLDLCSTVTYMPPMPAVEPGISGSKGTTLNPTVVLCAYNNPLPADITVDRAALLRRLYNSYEVLPPRWNEPQIAAADPQIGYFQLLATDKTNDLPNELQGRSPGFYYVPLTIVADGDKKDEHGNAVMKEVWDYANAGPASLDIPLYKELWRFRHTWYTYEDSQITEHKSDTLDTCDVVISRIRAAVDLRVARFLGLLKDQGLSFRTDFNAYIDKLRLAALTGDSEETVLKDLFHNIQVEVSDFVAKHRGSIEAAQRTDIVDIEVEEFESVPTSDTEDEDAPADVAPEPPAPAPAAQPEDGAKPQGPKTVWNRVFHSRKVLKRSQVEKLEDAVGFITDGLVNSLPVAQPHVVAPARVENAVSKETAADIFAVQFPAMLDFIKTSTELSFQATEACSLLNPTEEICSKYPIFAHPERTKVMYDMIIRGCPQSQDVWNRTKEQYGFPDRVTLQWSAKGHALWVHGTLITNPNQLWTVSFSNSQKTSWYGYVDSCPAHFLNFWNDDTNRALANTAEPYVRDAVADLPYSCPEQRCSYPDFPVISPKSDPFANSHVACPDRWSFCSRCLRFFPPNYSRLPNICVASPTAEAHRFVWLTDQSTTDNLNSLRKTVPKADYLYFCAMAIILVYKSACLRQLTSRMKHSSLCLTPDELRSAVSHFTAEGARIHAALDDKNASKSDFDDDGTLSFFKTEEALLSNPVVFDPHNPFFPPLPPPKPTHSHSMVHWIGVGLVCVGILTTVLRFTSRLFHTDAPAFTPESALPRATTNRLANAPKTSPINVRKLTSSTPQSPVREVTLCAISVDGSPSVRGFIPTSNYAFTYCHGLAPYLGEGPHNVSVFVEGKTLKFPLSPDLFAYDADHDICVFYIPPSLFPPRRDLLNQFPLEKDLAFGIGVNAALRVDSRDYIATTTYYPNCTYNIPDAKRADLASFHHQFTFSYPIHTRSGDCGCLLRALDGPIAGSYIGMHVATARGSASSQIGVSAPIFREILMALINAIDPTVVSRSMRQRPDDLQILETLDVVAQGPESFAARLAGVSGPNLDKIETIPVVERVNVPTRSSYIPTEFADDPRFSGKKPSVMMPNENGDPAAKAFQKLADITHPPIDHDLLVRCQAEQLEKLKTLNFHGVTRELTFTEAVAGIPSLLSSLRISSSAGYPLTLMCPGKGKTSMVRIESDGRVSTTRFFYDRVTGLVAMLRQGDPAALERYPFYWLAFLKDELRSDKKVAECNTRVIYCNSLEWMVAGRMLFGALQVAFNNNAGNSIFASGINVNSHDLQTIADYLRQVSLINLLAGDYSGFDIHYHPEFQKAAYANMRDLGLARITGFNAKAFDIFVRHELNPIVQFGDVRMTFKSSHFSGCFFTTPENCLVNELYFMYVFYRIYPKLDWNQETRFVALGDDHLVACSSNIPAFNARSVCEYMKELGQVYTDENKEVPNYSYKPFTECSFLGSSPQLLRGRFAGALRLPTLYSNLAYVTKDTDLPTLIETFLDLASVHPYPVFKDYLDAINEVWGVHHNCLFADSYEARQLRQIERTADSGFGYWKPDAPNIVTPQGPDDPTSVQAEVHTASDIPPSSTVDVSRAVGVSYASLTAPTSSPMFLGSFTWSNTDVQGKRLFSSALPGKAVKQLMQQTMPFAFYRYWHGDVELMFQVNGNNFQAGALVAVYFPLKSQSYDCAFNNVLCGEHALLEPRNSNAVTLRVPFRYFTDLMSTEGILSGDDFLGTIVIYVLSPLMSSAATSVTVTVFSSFPNSQFYGPTYEQAIPQGPKRLDDPPTTIGVSDLVGLIPGSDAVTQPIRKLNKLLNAKFIAMDDTPVSNGSLPLVNQFPGMSSTVGPKPQLKAALNPAEFYRKTEQIFEPGETTIASLCGREGILRTFDWKTNQTAGTALQTLPLNSLCSDPPSSGTLAIPVNLAVLNCFLYWHADFKFYLRVFKTPFHSGRLRVSLALDQTLVKTPTLLEQNLLFNQILDYSGSDEVLSFTVPFIAAREFLYTVSSAVSANTDKIGYLTITVLNPLVVSTATVSSTVKCLLSVSLENVRVAVPHPIPPVNFSNQAPSVVVKPQGPESGEADVAEEPASVPFGTPDAPDEAPAEAGDLNKSSAMVGAIYDIMEVARRAVPISVVSSVRNHATMSSSEGDYNVFTLALKPTTIFSSLFAAYSGGLKVRVVGNASVFSYIPEGRFVNAVPIATTTNAYNGPAVTSLSGKTDRNNYTVSRVQSMCAVEMAYPLPDGNYFIDLELPFQTPVNFYSSDGVVRYHAAQVADFYPLLQLTVLGTSAFRGWSFASCADDGLYGIFVPPAKSEYWWTGPGVSYGALV
ncbi:polyprotein [Picornavirales Tottori-HG1]|uniref:polyprotein n=1 Tax=Picornavirales Tottori-HG1 TaxID=1795648 RepID=UPI0008110A16|nr:polyprotein [Picornavirales Tottori-HG1]BAV31549.1 polyprotein [Picornavirales Tottori-HG1]